MEKNTFENSELTFSILILSQNPSKFFWEKQENFELSSFIAIHVPFNSNAGILSCGEFNVK